MSAVNAGCVTKAKTVRSQCVPVRSLYPQKATQYLSLLIPAGLDTITICFDAVWWQPLCLGLLKRISTTIALNSSPVLLCGLFPRLARHRRAFAAERW
jgi:hypothetical protein